MMKNVTQKDLITLRFDSHQTRTTTVASHNKSLFTSIIILVLDYSETQSFILHAEKRETMTERLRNDKTAVMLLIVTIIVCRKVFIRHLVKITGFKLSQSTLSTIEKVCLILFYLSDGLSLTIPWIRLNLIGSQTQTL